MSDLYKRRKRLVYNKVAWFLSFCFFKSYSFIFNIGDASVILELR